MPDRDGLPHLPDFDDIEQIEWVLIPALEAWVNEAERESDQWAIRLTLLANTRNRLLALKTTADVKAMVAELLRSQR